MKVVVVESPSKAKTINKYLGPGYEVLASFGHIRDLPAKDGSTILRARSKAPTRLFWQPTLTAKAKPSPGTCWKR